MARIAIITDAWEPQINGVVTTYKNTAEQLTKLGHYCQIEHPKQFFFKTVPLPGYKEIRVVINPWQLKHSLNYYITNGWNIHIATEGPIGLYARLYLSWKKYPFTTCYHSKFPEFIKARTGIKTKFTYPYFKWFHKLSKCVMVPTIGMKEELEQKGFKRVKVWTRGVDTDLYRPIKIVRPYILCVSRVSAEKNLEAFCELSYRDKVLVGDGPQLAELKAKYPKVLFTGALSGLELAQMYSEASAFVFPSQNDTFGLVMLESIASGTPVAALPGPGANEVIDGTNGCISMDLDAAVQNCLTLNRGKVWESSWKWTWVKATENFLKNIIN